MSIGSWLDDRIGDAIVAAGRLADRALNVTWPSELLERIEANALQFLAMPIGNIDFDEGAAGEYLAGPERLAEAEAERDSWEPDEITEPVGEYPDLPKNLSHAEPPVGSGDSAEPVSAHPGSAHSDLIPQLFAGAERIVEILRTFYPTGKPEYRNYVAADIVTALEYPDGGDAYLVDFVKGVIANKLNASEK